MKRYRLPVVVEKDEYGYFAYCPQLQGCYTQGSTYEEVIENIEDAVHLHIEDILGSKDRVPESKLVSLTSLEVAV